MTTYEVHTVHNGRRMESYRQADSMYAAAQQASAGCYADLRVEERGKGCDIRGEYCEFFGILGMRSIVRIQVYYSNLKG